MSNELAQSLKKQKYHLVGGHSAVKRCRWLYESLIHDRSCYKQRFYGIKSHQCIQMTPAVIYCTLHCRFCWRLQSGDLQFTWEETSLPEWEDPKTLVEGCITEQRRILSGYKGNPETDPEKYREALRPKHAAISLAGEPTLYSPLKALIHEFHNQGFTTFLVTNGTVPQTLSQLDEEPTQLYISVPAYNKKTYLRTCRPQIPRAWEKLNQTLSLLPSFKCPTVIRITLARNLNLKHPEQYAHLIKQAKPTYIEPKAYMHVGFSRLRLGYENMPTHKEIRSFATKLSKHTGYNILDESEDSRVVLLSHLDKPIKLTG
ncbi:4-demethylwyosine synthase TYW1 [Candidatus Bathyarchaeota archaeon]|nr:4-demethylwyosine synthase TYW1 [Candidatus Bathyarchaeota archaeon]NIR15953.1 4-demethylwyosine synthase TYW1 [Desulfobacterales bacterium]NIU81303.1 4-demethylwyosine synthase TYW1 [Candidatus Bathyarchaeota archaeon]NIV68181.1 4-demethylwyosine synthase TYW1 [Candidatus Bathyarchaeota archaeon]NIW16293.1 4-demethylwyosine synthase TYW1 [Candidatus Bathyarchaeota archaeon]